MQDSGIAILFKGINFQRLLGGLWVTLRIALVSIGLSCALGLLFGRLTHLAGLEQREPDEDDRDEDESDD